MSETRVVHITDRIEGAVYIGRAVPRNGIRASPLANPYKIGTDWDRSSVVSAYRNRMHGLILIRHRPTIAALIECRGKALACWCRHDGEQETPDNTCHGDVIIEFLELYTDDELRAMGGAA